MSDDPHTVMFKEGGTINGRPFNCFADLFSDLGCTFVGDGFTQGGGYSDPRESQPYRNTLTSKQKKQRSKNNKRERQRRKKGRK